MVPCSILTNNNYDRVNYDIYRSRFGSVLKYECKRPHRRTPSSQVYRCTLHWRHTLDSMRKYEFGLASTFMNVHTSSVIEYILENMYACSLTVTSSLRRSGVSVTCTQVSRRTYGSMKCTTLTPFAHGCLHASIAAPPQRDVYIIDTLASRRQIAPVHRGASCRVIAPAPFPASIEAPPTSPFSSDIRQFTFIQSTQ